MIAECEVIDEYMEEHGFPPRFQDVAEILGLKTGTCHARLVKLKAAGWVSWRPRFGRTLTVTPEYYRTFENPYGAVPVSDEVLDTIAFTEET